MPAASLKQRDSCSKGILTLKWPGMPFFAVFWARQKTAGGHPTAKKSMKNSRIAQMLVDKLSENNYNGYSEFRVNIFLRLL
jgi:hypothetical protein